MISKNRLNARLLGKGAPVGRTLDAKLDPICGIGSPAAKLEFQVSSF
jgi:hypothetical protein